MLQFASFSFDACVGNLHRAACWLQLFIPTVDERLSMDLSDRMREGYYNSHAAAIAAGCAAGADNRPQAAYCHYGG